MPELPEVETICRSLNKAVKGKTIARATVIYAPLIKSVSEKTFAKKIKGKTILDVKRIGKAVRISLSDNLDMLIQLKMTGKFSRPQNKTALTKHTRLNFIFSDKQMLAFEDIRKFACIYLDTKENIDSLPYIKTLGCDPLTKRYTLKHFKDAAKKHGNKNIKSFLLDQHIIAGIGNIYASEILFLAHVNPNRLTNSLSEKETKALYTYIPEILKEAIKHKGTTFSDYRDIDGNTGNFFKKLAVYKRENQKCISCAEKIMNIKIAGRSSFFCPKCQK